MVLLLFSGISPSVSGRPMITTMSSCTDLYIEISAKFVQGLMSVLVDVRDNPKEDLNNFKDQLRSYTEGLEEVQWLKPPMLTKPLKDSNAMWK